MFRISILTFVLVWIVYAQEKEETKFPDNTPVIMLNEDDFDRMTKLGVEPVTTPWYIYFYTPWCPACRRLVPIWEDISRKYNGQVNIAAVDGDECPNLVDRYGISNYPLLMLFAANNQMYRFDGVRNQENITHFGINEGWQENIEEGEDIPIEISQFKRYIRKLFHPIMIPILIVVCFVGLIIYICIEDKKYEKEKMAEAKVVKVELIRREKVRREKEELKQKQLQQQQAGKQRIEHEEEEKQGLLKDKKE